MLKIQIYPTQTQTKFFNRCFGASRYIYNKCVDFYRHNRLKDDTDPTKLKKFDFFSLKPFIVKTNSVLDKDDWIRSIPFETRRLAVAEFSAALKAAKSNQANGNIKFYNFKYRTKKDHSQTFNVANNALTKKLRLFTRTLKEPLKTSSKDALKLKCYIQQGVRDFKVQCILGRYYLLLPKTVKPIRDKSFKIDRIVALDPGVRTFQTFYSSDGLAGKINPTRKLQYYNNKLAKMKKYRVSEKKMRATRLKIYNSVTDLHWQCASFLTNNFELGLFGAMSGKTNHHLTAAPCTQLA